MNYVDPCSKTLRMMITYYQRQLMDEHEHKARETYKLLLRSLDRQLISTEEKEQTQLERELVAYQT